MRDKTHMESVIRWADFVKANPDKWQEMHNKFINAQFDMHEQFLRRILKEDNGKQKIIELYGIENLNGYPILK